MKPKTRKSPAQPAYTPPPVRHMAISVLFAMKELRDQQRRGELEFVYRDGDTERFIAAMKPYDGDFVVAFKDGGSLELAKNVKVKIVTTDRVTA